MMPGRCKRLHQDIRELYGLENYWHCCVSSSRSCLALTIDLEVLPKPDVTITLPGMVEGWYCRDFGKEGAGVICQRVKVEIADYMRDKLSLSVQ